MEIMVRNVNSALCAALKDLSIYGCKEDSRNGPVLSIPGPVTIFYTRPTERVLFSPTRDANPFFHLMEAMWMLAGRNDLEFVQQFNKRFSEYSDDGRTIPGAYGYRWRHYFGRDQIEAAIAELKANPNSRRVVVSMWSAQDLGKVSNDLPCNTHIYFDTRMARLNMTVCNRSNDAVWGATGANAVHFSILQEFVAASLQLPVGEYRQFTNNLHIYTDTFTDEWMAQVMPECTERDYYSTTADVKPWPLVYGAPECFMESLNEFLRAPMADSPKIEDVFIKHTVVPMYAAWHHHRVLKDTAGALLLANKIVAMDWRRACIEWLARRIK